MPRHAKNVGKCREFLDQSKRTLNIGGCGFCIGKFIARRCQNRTTVFQVSWVKEKSRLLGYMDWEGNLFSYTHIMNLGAPKNPTPS